jgi:hypothetical protein
MKMKREFIEGMKCLGSIASILLQGALESMAKAQEENGNTYREECREESLEEQWKRELYYYSDERLDEELRRCLVYNYNVVYDGRNKCIEKIAEIKARNNYKVC